jgi:hypothetical protein
MSFDALLNKLVTIKRLSGSTDRYGNIEKVYTNLATDIAFRFDEQTGTEVEADANSTIKRARGFTRYSDIEPADLIEYDSEIWEVVAYPLLRQKANNNHHYELDLKKVNP